MMPRFSLRLLVLALGALMILGANRHAEAAETGILLLAHGTHSIMALPRRAPGTTTLKPSPAT
jgi:hypothetical protein